MTASITALQKSWSRRPRLSGHRAPLKCFHIHPRVPVVTMLHSMTSVTAYSCPWVSWMYQEQSWAPHHEDAAGADSVSMAFAREGGPPWLRRSQEGREVSFHLWKSSSKGKRCEKEVGCCSPCRCPHSRVYWSSGFNGAAKIFRVNKHRNHDN